MFLVVYRQKESVRIQYDIVTCQRWTKTSATRRERQREKKSEKHDSTRTHTMSMEMYGEQGSEKWLHPNENPTACMPNNLYYSLVLRCYRFFVYFFFYLLPIYSMNCVRQNKLDAINENRNKCFPPTTTTITTTTAVCRCRPTTFTYNYFGFNVTK